MNAYSRGTAILVGRHHRQVVGASSVDDLAAVIRLRDVEGLVKKQGGAAGEIAYKLAPNTVKQKAYSTLAQKLYQGLVEQGVDADVTVQSTLPSGAVSTGDFLNGAAVGVAGVGIGWLFWKYVVKRFVGGRR